jgi:hypothetical protein
MMPKTNTTTTVPIIMAVINAAKSLFMAVFGRSACVFIAVTGPLGYGSHYKLKPEGEYVVAWLGALFCTYEALMSFFSRPCQNVPHAIGRFIDEAFTRNGSQSFPWG